jgi:Skp family chaperone for outer membrane proteins
MCGTKGSAGIVRRCGGSLDPFAALSDPDRLCMQCRCLTSVQIQKGQTMFSIAMLATLLFAAGPDGQAQQTPPAATPGLAGPLVSGVCLISREAIYINAAVGKAASARLKVLSDQADAEIRAERTPLEADLKAFQAESAKLSADVRATRDRALVTRLQALQGKTQLRSREIEATRVKAMRQISDQAQSVITAAYNQKKCGLLIDRNTVLGGNMGNDLTPEVIKGLDAKVTTITFDREILPANPPAQ